MNNNFYIGCVENRNDPLKLGRCQVRVVGLHTIDKNKIKTEDLPWAHPMLPITSASMSGIGHAPTGPVEGTWVIIMFRDEDCQLPIMVGTIPGIPQDNSEADGIILKDDSGKTPILSQQVVANQDNQAVVTSDPNAGTTAQASTATPSTDIPTVPPPDWKGDRSKASAGIKALLAACDKAGLTTREQKCSVLAIAGGECGWIPQEEGYSYSSFGLQSTFKSTFSGKPELADKYARWKGSRQDFFAFVYAPENNGRQLGNTQTGDGGKFFGRGFNQITGRANYTKYAKLSGVDILNNPDLLQTDLDKSAYVTCVMIKDKTSKSVNASANPDWFFAAKKANGNDTGNGAIVRTRYYEYFYGTQVEASQTEEKTAGTNVNPNSTGANAGQYDIGELGFRDPNNKYPLKSFVHEPDVNRLARGIKKGTIVPIKEANRVLGIKKALSKEIYDEPTSPYAAKYPYNHVIETESGHVQEFDDTPGMERINTFHRKGTFTEIDANGTEVHHVVGDKYTIVDRNGCIYITGECNLSVDGNINILCQSNANIEVTGDAEMQVGGNYNLGVAGNMNVGIGGKLNVLSKGNMTFQSLGSGNIITGKDLNQFSTGSTNIRSAGNFAADASMIFMNSGKAKSPSTINVPVPANGTPLNKTVPYTIPPSTEGEEVFTFESEEDWKTPQGIAAKEAIEKKYGKQTPENVPAQDQVTETSGGAKTNTVASCTVIYNTEDFNDSFKLSDNFNLGMLYDHAGNHKLVNQCGLTKQQIICNLSQLCQNILEPALSILPGGIKGYGKQWTINSGYRQLSNGVGSSTSDHPYGRAIDLSLLPKDDTRNQRHFEFIQQLEKILPYDQLILEYRSGNQCWMHIGYRGLKAGDTTGPGGINRKMAFTMLNDQTYKKDNKTGFYLL